MIIDYLSILSLIISAVVLLVIIFLWRELKNSPTHVENNDLELVHSEIKEIKNSISNLTNNFGNISQSIGEIKNASNNIGSILSVTGEIKSSTEGIKQMIPNIGAIKESIQNVSAGMKDVQEFVTLMSGSSQKKGSVGEAFIRSYLNTLPRELWEEQFQIPGGNGGRVDFAIKIISNEKNIYIPIDAKFSIPSGNLNEEDFKKQANRLAKSRSEEVVKYIVPDSTTDFAVMVLPNPVYYSLTDETLSEISKQRVVPTPVEGIIILSVLALRAHQSIAIQQRTLEVRDLITRVSDQLEKLVDSVNDLESKLRNAHNFVKKTQNVLDDTVQELKNITNHMEKEEQKI